MTGGPDEAPTPRKRPGGRTARTGAAVQAATLEILAAEGYGSLTIDEVAKRSSVHRTTIYRRWGSRERLVVDALGARSTTEIPLPDTGTARGDIEEVAGLVYRREGEICRSGAMVRLRDIDELPWPAWDLIPVENYMKEGHGFGVNRGRSMPIIATRGCPYRCTFCSSPSMWTLKVR